MFVYTTSVKFFIIW